MRLLRPRQGSGQRTGRRDAIRLRGTRGHGELWLTLTTHCSGDINWFTAEVPFTSSDLNASCEPDAATDVIDLGIWAACLPPGPYCVRTDLSCDGTVNVLDLGIFAGGLHRGCDDAVCQ